MLKKLTPNRESHMSVTDRATYCWWQIPTLQIFFDTLCDRASQALSDKYSCDLVLDNVWRTERINGRDSIEKFIGKLAEKLMAAPPRPSGQVALAWVAKTTMV